MYASKQMIVMRRDLKMRKGKIAAQAGHACVDAVLRALAREGRLGHFFTDICGTKSWPALLRKLPPGLLPQAVRRLAGRVPSGVPAELITDFPLFGLRSGIRRLRIENAIEETSHAVWAGSRFSSLVAGCGFHDAAGLYAYTSDRRLFQKVTKKPHSITAAAYARYGIVRQSPLKF